MKRLTCLHPFLFALLPTLSLLSFNLNDAPLIHALRPALICLIAALLLLLLGKLLVREWPLAALLCSLALMLFFSFGHVLYGLVPESVRGIFARSGLMGRSSVLGLLWLALLVFGSWALIRLRDFRPQLITFFTITAAIGVGTSVVRIAVHEVQLAHPWPGSPEIAPISHPHGSARPDIYYIILDGYARADLLDEVYNLENQSFLQFLREQGFYIAEQSRSNYIQTGLSLASSLNMTYIDFLSDRPGPNSKDRIPLARLIRWNAVRAILEEQGYRVVALSSGYRMTEWENSTDFQRAPVRALTTLERLLIETSALTFIQEFAPRWGAEPFFPGYAAHRDQIRFTMDQIEASSRLAGPKFVFAHILAPHPPFVFGQDGEVLPQSHPYTLRDGNAYLGTQSEYITGFRGQVLFINRWLQELIPILLNASETPPVIILQADHGPGLSLDWDSADNSDLNERTAILNAYHMPEGMTADLYPSISPVNSFRLVLKTLFGQEMGLLADQSYFATLDHPYRFIPIPEDVIAVGHDQ
jgi:hypothetical protein